MNVGKGEKYFKTKKFKKYVTSGHLDHVMNYYESPMNTSSKQFILYHNISIFLHK